MPNRFNALTSRQNSFVLNYAQTRNGVAAARLAGYKGNAHQLSVIASQNLGKPSIQKFLQELSAPALEKAQVTIQKVVEELAAIAFAPWKDYMKIKYDDAGNVIHAKLNLSQKLTALRLLADHLGMLNQDSRSTESPSLALHWREGMTAEEARQQLIAFLRQ